MSIKYNIFHGLLAYGFDYFEKNSFNFHLVQCFYHEWVLHLIKCFIFRKMQYIICYFVFLKSQLYCLRAGSNWSWAMNPDSQSELLDLLFISPMQCWPLFPLLWLSAYSQFGLMDGIFLTKLVYLHLFNISKAPFSLQAHVQALKYIS